MPGVAHRPHLGEAPVPQLSCYGRMHGSQERFRDNAGREPRWIVPLISGQVAASDVIVMAAKSPDVLFASG